MDGYVESKKNVPHETVNQYKIREAFDKIVKECRIHANRF